MIVVTGAAGFIGSNVAALAARRGLGPVLAVDWPAGGGKASNLAGAHIAEFVAPERAFDALDHHRTRIRAVLHMGAISDTTERDIRKLAALNIRYSTRLWDWCAQNGVSFIYASSAATYGARESEFRDDQTVSFLAGLRPMSAYGWSKAATDRIFARRIACGKAVPPYWAGLKFFNVYGPNERHKGEMRSIVLKVFDAVRAGRPVKLFKSYRPGVADGEQKRDFVYVHDCSDAVLWFMAHGDVSGIFNIGTGRARSFIDAVAAVSVAMRCAPDIEFIDMPPPIRDQYQYFTQADMAKARAAGLETEFSPLERGIDDYVNNYLLNIEPCEQY